MKVSWSSDLPTRGQKPDTGSPVTIEETPDMSVENSYQPLKPEPQPVAF